VVTQARIELAIPFLLEQEWERDLDSNSFSGVPLGGAFEQLAFLGPANRPNALLWEFSPVGVAVEMEDGRIVGGRIVDVGPSRRLF
jgi:hypothetical protein